MTFQLNY